MTLNQGIAAITQMAVECEERRRDHESSLIERQLAGLEVATFAEALMVLGYRPSTAEARSAIGAIVDCKEMPSMVDGLAAAAQASVEFDRALGEGRR